jgi:hypothetical protein
MRQAAQGEEAGLQLATKRLRSRGKSNAVQTSSLHGIDGP